jgi:hypothetical protein
MIPEGNPTKNVLSVVAQVIMMSFCIIIDHKREELRQLHPAEVIASHSGLLSHHCR